MPTPRTDGRMNQLDRFLRVLWIGLSLLLLAAAAIIAFELHASSLPLLKAKTFWALIIGAAFFAVAARKFSQESKIKMFLLLVTLFLGELLLQIAAWLGVLPAVNTKERLPWGRVYWTGEGRGNSIRNRHAWHFPEFNLENSKRVAVIGDSFVEAVEVARSRTLSAVLRPQLENDSDPWSVLGLGNHGTGPAHYLEILKYAHHHFAVSQAVIVVYLGNDITDSSRSLQSSVPGFIYYEKGADGFPVLNADGRNAVEAYRRSLEASHRPVWQFLPRLVISHCMSVQLPLSVRSTRAVRQRLAQTPSASAHPGTALARLGLKAAPFATNRAPEVREAIEIAQGVLGLAAEFARTNRIALRLVTVPFFPPDFYAQRGTNWTARLGEYDFLGLEEDFKSWTARHQVPFLALGDLMRRRGLSTEEIQSLYLSNGSGHFSEAGHRFAADAIRAQFFPPSDAGAPAGPK